MTINSKLLLYQSTRLVSTKEWFDKNESLWSHLIVCQLGRFAFFNWRREDWFNERKWPSRKALQDVLEQFNLYQHIGKHATRVTKKLQTSIDHVISNYPSRITHTDILPCSFVSDQDGRYACINIRAERFQSRLKYIKNMKTLNSKAFQRDFSILPLHLVYSFDGPNSQ